MPPAESIGRWRTAIATPGPEAEAIRAGLGSVHWYPVYAYLRASGFAPETAADLAESVLASFIDEEPPAEQQTLTLREWIHGLCRQAAAEPALQDPVLKLPREWAEERFAQETPRSPDETFSRRWTMGLIEDALASLEQEYQSAGRGEVFAAGQKMLGFTGGPQGDENYAELAGMLGITLGAARKIVFELRGRYRELLQERIADTVADPGQIRNELNTLLAELPPPATTAAPRSIMCIVNPEELLARGMNSVKMSTAGGLGWTPPSLAEAAGLFPGYEVIALLGHGGMGAVYEARQTSLDRLVAIKLLPLEISVDPMFAERFRREARAMAKLNHPNIIAVHDFGQTPEGHLFFVMDFVDGATLHEVIYQDSNQLDHTDCLGIVEQVCDALAYAHEEGVVHRDIKPANVMIDHQLRAKVTDFGLARLTDPASKEEWGMTMTGILVGTPDYMAPEQKRGQHVDHRADLYSVGVMIYEMLCRETPQGAFEMASARCGLDSRIDTIISKALATQPERRYQSARDLKTAVKAVRSTIAPSQIASHPVPVAMAPARPSTRVPHVPARPSRAQHTVAWTIAIAVVAVGAILFFATSGTMVRNRSQLNASSTPSGAAGGTPASVNAASTGGNSTSDAAMNAAPATGTASAPRAEESSTAAPTLPLPLAPPSREVLTFQGRQYKLIPGVMTWEVAKGTAEKMGGHLASITTPEEHAWVTQNFLRENTCFWLGGHRDPAGTWKWVTGEEWKFTAWSKSTDGKSEPSGVSADGEPETALEMAKYGTTAPPGGWNDRSPAAASGSTESDGFLVEWEERNIVSGTTPPEATTLQTSGTPVETTPAEPKAAREVVQWVTDNHAAYEAQWKKEAIAPFEATVKQLRTNYVAGVERAIATHSLAARLEDAIAWRNEKARLDSGQAPHDSVDDPKEPLGLRQYRDNWRKAYARLDADRLSRARAVHARFDALLEKAQTGYTQRQRFEDALCAKLKREEIAKAWLTPAYQVGRAASSAQPSPPKPLIGSLMHAPRSNEGLLVGRDAVLHLRGLGFYVTYRDDDGVERMITPGDAPDTLAARGKFEIIALNAPDLRRIDAGTATIIDSDFVKLAPLRALRSFEFRGTGTIKGTGLAFLAGSSDLETITLSDPSLTDDALRPFLGLRKVKNFTFIPGQRRTDYSLLSEANFLPELEQATLGGTAAKDSLTAIAARLRNLKALSILDGKELGRAELAALAGLTSLERAAFNGLNEDGVASLAGLDRSWKLTTLDLGGSDAGSALAFIAKCRKLEHLIIDAKDAPGLSVAAGAPALQVIQFSDSGPPANDTAITAIAKAFPKLEALDFGATEHYFTSGGIKELASLPRLTRVTWARKPIAREILIELAALPQLETLDINSSRIAEDDLTLLAASKTISTLVLMHNGNITSRCAEMLKGMPKLRALNLYSTAVKATDLPAMQRLLPRVAINLN